MTHSFRITALASALGALVASGASAATPDFRVADINAAPADAPALYIVRFEEAGVLHYAGGVGGIPAISSPSRSRKLDVGSPAAQAYQAYLGARRVMHQDAIAAALGRPLVVTHRYAITMNGIAAWMTPAEAAIAEGVAGVASVRASRRFDLDTFRGPEFIGAGTLWDGSGTPSGLATRGQGVVVGVVDTGTNSTHPSFADDETCGFGASNHKLLGAVDCFSTDANGVCNGDSPEADDGNGHGVHTASTAAGNTIDGTANPAPTIPAPHTTMSGVAPCAQVRSYKVCNSTDGCTDASITAGIENAVADQVDVINYSIGPTCGSTPGDSPWSDGDEIWLDATYADIFVAASAGNTRSNCTDPTGKVANISPWVTTVAASTHDETVVLPGSISVTAPMPVPPGLVGIAMTAGSGPDAGQATSGLELRHDVNNPVGCGLDAFPPGFFDGAAALISRGSCTFEEKILNAEAAGAVLAIVYNDRDGIVSMSVGSATLPAYSITQVDGNALVDFIAASDPAAVTIDFAPALEQGDVLAGFSFRGPDVLGSITKPDLTAPGVHIYAALDAAEGSYGYYSGTSMSSPHTAGAAALLRAVHPDWTPSEVKSALMLTAFTGGTEEDGITPWTPDDVGAGRVDLSKAALAGFVLDESYDHYVAADPDAGGDPTTLNLASVRNVDGCDAPNPCTWTRELRNVLPASSSWTVSVDAPTGVVVAIDPPMFAFAGTGIASDTVLRDGFDGPPAPETQSLTITATTDPTLSGPQFARITFHEANGMAPDAHIDVALRGTVPIDNSGVDCANGQCDFRIDALSGSFGAIGCSTYCGLLWLNRFTPDAADYPITLTSVSTIFGASPGWNATGDHINVYVYQDDDEDPSNGAALVGAEIGYTMPDPADAFTTITLSTPIVLNGPGDVLIALTNPAPNTGTYPASADQGPYAGRSWASDSFVDAGVAPNLAAVSLVENPMLIQGFNGNWLIRASGTNGSGNTIVLGLPKKI